MIASCTAPHPGLCSQSAPRKRQQSGMHSVNVLFLRPKSARIPADVVSQSLQCRGLVGCATRKAARRSLLRFPSPASSRHPAGSPLN